MSSVSTELLRHFNDVDEYRLDSRNLSHWLLHFWFFGGHDCVTWLLFYRSATADAKTAFWHLFKRLDLVPKLNDFSILGFLRSNNIFNRGFNKSSFMCKELLHFRHKLALNELYVLQPLLIYFVDQHCLDTGLWLVDAEICVFDLHCRAVLWLINAFRQNLSWFHNLWSTYLYGPTSQPSLDYQLLAWFTQLLLKNFHYVNVHRFQTVINIFNSCIAVDYLLLSVSNLRLRSVFLVFNLLYYVQVNTVMSADVFAKDERCWYRTQFTERKEGFLQVADRQVARLTCVVLDFLQLGLVKIYDWF